LFFTYLLLFFNISVQIGGYRESSGAQRKLQGVTRDGSPSRRITDSGSLPILQASGKKSVYIGRFWAGDAVCSSA